VQADGRGFHRHRLSAIGGELREHPVQFDRVRRRVCRRSEITGIARPQRPDDTATAPDERQSLRNPLAHRCLAVRPRHAGDPEALRRPSVHDVRDMSCKRAKTGHAHIGDSPARIPVECLALPQNRRGTARYRRADMAPAVRRLPRVGEKHITGVDTPAVGAQGGHIDPLVSQLVENSVDGVAHWHSTLRCSPALRHPRGAERSASSAHRAQRQAGAMHLP